MDFLKSKVKGAVAAFGKDVSLPFTIGAQVDNFNSTSLWTLHDGKKKDDGSAISIFIFDIERNYDKVDLARNAFKRARTIRHPALLTFIDGVENEKNIIIATEKVIPLNKQLAKEKDENLITWGLYKIAVALKFLNSDCQLIHGSVRKSSIFSTQAGEWKLSGLELCCSLKDDYPIIFSSSTNFFNPSKYSPPEVRKESWNVLQKYPNHVLDAYDYGCLIYELFNDTEINDPSEVRNLSKIPKSVQPYYKTLLHENPNYRSSVEQFLESAMQRNGFFDIPFVKACLFLENISVKEKTEKEQFIRNLSNSIDSFPTEFSKHKILPELINALEYGAGGSRVLLPILKLGASLSKEEYDKVILGSIVKMYGSPDRQMRLMLLENMDKYIDKISDNSKIINDKIFPQIVTGFNDTSSIIREATIKSILLLGPKLSDRIINNDLLRYLAKLQIDEEPGIRTNTTILIGKLAKNLSPSTRKRILIPAFARSLKDPFVPSRNAGLLAFNASSEIFDVEEMATKIIPSISPCLIDPDKYANTFF
ncbi:ARM repeat-containing protein [Neocallimastix californiae]|uniref:ARM repeat-containing protein n=1 Tax=Neocallimastix californiae TaxID=1754190 RepID=A0A1Y2C928_9FUNG|nr:ARM repeat-containing protein [Neocallimastix californiae]|eukprot:ORY43541.1 ARM repeat-containing protein [Neocallimastix californiae]